jgi:hypothetical protein
LGSKLSVWYSKKKEEVMESKEALTQKVDVPHKLWLEIAEEVQKDGK